MRLHDLLGATDVLEVLNDSPVDVSDVTHDSRSVRPGALFCCIPGMHRDGHDFAARAVDDGAVALLVDRQLAVAVPQARVQSVRAAAGPTAARVHGDPSHQLPVLGVTGTNGKTTTTFLLEAIFIEAGRHPALVGTAGVRCDGASIGAARFTTPEAPDLQRTLADLLARGADVVAMEVSSHALVQEISNRALPQHSAQRRVELLQSNCPRAQLGHAHCVQRRGAGVHRRMQVARIWINIQQARQHLTALLMRSDLMHSL